jgi:Flp pilus assembly protein TadG
MSLRPSAIRRLLVDLAGVSAVEFAFILPVMLTLYIGTFEIAQGVSIQRKVTLTAHTVADLVSQASTVASMGDIFAATTTIMAPFATSSTNFTMLVSQVQVLSNGTATVYAGSGFQASCGYNTTALSNGATVTVPSSLVDTTRRPI